MTRTYSTVVGSVTTHSNSVAAESQKHKVRSVHFYVRQGTVKHSLDALQYFHQLGLLVRGHPSKHGRPQQKLRRPRVERKGYSISEDFSLMLAS